MIVYSVEGFIKEISIRTSPLIRVVWIRLPERESTESEAYVRETAQGEKTK